MPPDPAPADVKGAVMQTHEIPDDNWLGFFNQFSKDHVGWPVTIEVLEADAGPQRIANELPLQGLSFDPVGSRPCTIQVGAGDDPSANFSHVVDLPLYIRLLDGEDESGTIQIEPAKGPPTLIHFHKPA
jgi:hypothetical protein